MGGTAGSYYNSAPDEISVQIYISWGTAFPTKLHVLPGKTDQPAHLCSLIKDFHWAFCG